MATTENPKGEQTNLIAKRARASNLNHFVEILIKGIKAQARQMSTPATSNQMNENPTRHPKTENEKERKADKETSMLRVAHDQAVARQRQKLTAD